MGRGEGEQISKMGFEVFIMQNIDKFINLAYNECFLFFFDFERNVIYYNFDLLNLGIKKFMYYVNYNVLYLVNFEM